MAMRKALLTAAILALSAGGAMAQSPPAVEGPQNSAINSSDSSNRHAAGPVKGANSFTEGEARSRIEDRGFTSVAGLRKDDDGIWRGRGVKAGQTVEVALDYQGNVFFGTPRAMRPSSTTGQGLPSQSPPVQEGAGR